MSGQHLPNDPSWDAAEALWMQLFGEPPPLRCELDLLFDVLVKSLRSVGPYCLEHPPASPVGLGSSPAKAESVMPHQNTSSSKAAAQNSVTGYAPNDLAREENRAVHPDPSSYTAPNFADATVTAPAAGEMPEYLQEGDALDMEGSQQGSTNSNRPRVTDEQSGQGPVTRAANREIARSGRAS